MKYERLIIILCLIFVISISGCVFGGREDNNRNNIFKDKTGMITASVGVDAGPYVFDQIGDCQASAGWKFIQYSFSVETHNVTAHFEFLSLVDTDNFRYLYSYNESTCASEPLFTSRKINPGEHKDFILYFKVPANSVPKEMNYWLWGAGLSDGELTNDTGTLQLK
jgi:hypothetical protein